MLDTTEPGRSWSVLSGKLLATAPLSTEGTFPTRNRPRLSVASLRGYGLSIPLTRRHASQRCSTPRVSFRGVTAPPPCPWQRAASTPLLPGGHLRAIAGAHCCDSGPIAGISRPGASALPPGSQQWARLAQCSGAVPASPLVTAAIRMSSRPGTAISFPRPTSPLPAEGLPGGGVAVTADRGSRAKVQDGHCNLMTPVRSHGHGGRTNTALVKSAVPATWRAGQPAGAGAERS